MSVTKEIYNYLGVEVIESSSDDDLSSIELEYEEHSGYQSDVSYISDDDVGKRTSVMKDVKRKSVEPLDLVDKLETLAMLNFVSDILDLICRLGPYIRPTNGDRTSFNNKLNELIDALYDAPSRRIFKKNRACSDILSSLTMLKDELTKA